MPQLDRAAESAFHIVAMVVIAILVLVMLWYVQEAPLPVGGFR